MLGAALILCFLLLACANLISGCRMGFSGAAAFALLAFFAPFLIQFFSAPVAISAILLVVVGVMCANREAKLKTYRVWSVASTTFALLGCVVFALADLRRHEGLQRKYQGRRIKTWTQGLMRV